MVYRASFAVIVLTLLFIPASGQNKTIPFGIDKRPRPAGTGLNVLVPATVGSFTREQLPAGAKPRSDEDLNVTYKSGKVNMKGEQYVIGKDPSYFKVAGFMSWTRGKYFFYAKANSPAALEKFMRAFPF